MALMRGSVMAGRVMLGGIMASQRNGPVPPAYDPDAQAWFDRVALITPFSTPWKDAANAFILELKSKSLFTALTALNVFWVEVLGQEIVNALAPADNLTKLGTVILVPKVGITSDGVSGYYDTNYLLVVAPLTVGVMSISAPLNQPSLTGEATNSSMVCDMSPTASGTAAVVRIGQQNSVTWPNTTPAGHFAASRNVNVVTGYQDGVNKAHGNVQNFTVPGDNLFWMRRMNVYTTAQFGSAYRTQAVLTDTDISNLHNALTAFRTAVSAIP